MVNQRNARHSAAMALFGILATLCLAALAATGRSAVGQAGDSRVDYNRDVQPILSQNCFLCHGLDTNRRQAGLRLDNAETAYAKLPSGRVAIVPGDLKASEMVERITAHDPTQMPPADSGKKLTFAQIETLKRWIAQGAKYAPHWSYVPPQRPAVPKVKNAAWCRNPIDNFILARLEKESLHPLQEVDHRATNPDTLVLHSKKTMRPTPDTLHPTPLGEGLRPSPPADRATLIRRLSLDLIGLPPTPQEVQRFLNDRSPNAYEKVVDRLLASPHYGERMAVYWLDLVRYADTVGYHGDQDYSIWPYRDYVVNAFNKNKRFDAFTREQLAGDLLPNPTPETRVASGYNRLGMMSAEGGIQDKEYRAKYFADRVRNGSTVWLGSTMGCSECHNHKYDPFTQKDFYSFGAFFADLKEKGFYDNGFGGGDWGPNLRLPSPEQQARLAKFDADIAAEKRALAAVDDGALAGGRAQWETEVRARDAAGTLGWKVAKPERADSSDGSTLTIGADGAVLVSGKLPDFDTYTVTLPAGADKIASIRLQALPDGSLAGNGISRAGYYFILSAFEAAVERGGHVEPLKIADVIVDRAEEGFPGTALLDGRPDTGWALINGSGGTLTAVFHLAEPIAGGPDTKLIVRLRHQTKPRLAIGKFQIALSGLEKADLSAQGLPDAALAALRKAPDQRSADEKTAISAAYRSVAPTLEANRLRLEQLEGDRSLLMGQVPTTQVAEATEPRTIRVLPRGNWMDDSGAIVLPAAPHFLRQIAASGRATRLDLANWIVSPDNPLTARVFVNRLWKLFYGIGLSKSLDDFGAMGEPPVHPELLDWLATEFVASGWDVKHMVRLMVTANAYRESSNATPEWMARDPFNRLCARQSAVRIDAEFIRDMALSVSGLLTGQVGGPSVYPYEPRGYLAALNFPRREWAPDAGADLYRRGLYTQWQRTFLHPSLVAFDAPSREEATCTRAVSNTPLQSLVLMNDPTFVEAARVFAARTMMQGGKTFEGRVAFAFRVALSRAPRPQEVAILRTLFRSQRARYAADRAAATALVSTGESPVARNLDPVELAAWTSITRAILNLHETITRS